MPPLALKIRIEEYIATNGIDAPPAEEDSEEEHTRVDLPALKRQ